ncbi:MAG: hypothetical protein JXD19_04920 [Deltaproteobacteria bacterium]|nr:hypothetical protein [Deltaproteobacteria bacterium]
MMIFAGIMSLGGLVILGYGLWAIHYRTGPLVTIGGLLAPFGLLLALLGALLLCVPGFFSPWFG